MSPTCHKTTDPDIYFMNEKLVSGFSSGTILIFVFVPAIITWKETVDLCFRSSS